MSEKEEKAAKRHHSLHGSAPSDAVLAYAHPLDGFLIETITPINDYLDIMFFKHVCTDGFELSMVCDQYDGIALFKKTIDVFYNIFCFCVRIKDNGIGSLGPK